MELGEFFKKNKRLALAFSGGTDSAYLLYEAVRHNADVAVYCVFSEFQPEFELEDAKRLCDELGTGLNVIRLKMLDFRDIAANPPDRCYHCKKAIMEAVTQKAHADGYDVIADGTNASDDASDRPGMRALEEIGVISPLRLCKITKDEIRRRSKKAGLFTWNKPAYACLATRIPAGTAIDADTLDNIAAAEEELMKMGFSDFRVRVSEGAAKLQVRASQMTQVIRCREDIVRLLGRLFGEVFLDLKERDKS